MLHLVPGKPVEQVKERCNDHERSLPSSQQCCQCERKPAADEEGIPQMQHVSCVGEVHARQYDPACGKAQDENEVRYGG